MGSFDTTLSLQQLEKDFWPDEDEYSSGLVEKCHQFRKIPVQELTIEQLRLLMGQNIGNRYLVPLAIERLAKDILAEGDYYPGDLLHNVISTYVDYWKTHRAEWREVVMLIDGNVDRLKEEISVREFWRQVEAFRGIW